MGRGGAVHPLQVESVAWVTERRDVLSRFFFLLAVLSYLKAVERREAGGSTRGGARRLRRRSVGFAVLLREKIGAMVLVVATLAAGSWRQSRVWHDSQTLWRWAVSADPACMMCQINLGNFLLNHDRLAEAEAAFRAAAAARPESAGIHNNLGVVLVRSGRPDEAAAQFREAMRLAPGRIS